MAYARHIDPMTGQNQIENGVFKRAASPAVAKSVLRMRTRRGSIAVAPWLGNRLHEIERIDASAELRARSFALEAHADMVQAREITNLDASVTVETLPSGASALAIVVSFVDNRGERHTLRSTHRLQG